MINVSSKANQISCRQELERPTIFYFGDSNSIHFVKWVDYFASRGAYDIHCFTCSDNKIASVTMHMMGSLKCKLDYFLAISPVLYQVYKLKPALIHVHFLGGYSLWALLITTKIPVIGSALGSDVLVSPVKSSLKKILLCLFINKASRIISVSSYIKEKLISFGASPNKVKVIVTGIDTSLFNSIGRKKKTGKQSLKILCTNAHEPQYLIEIAVKAIGKLKAQGYDVELTLVGEGSETSTLRRIVQVEQIHGCVNFPGRLSFESLVEQLKNSDVYVSMVATVGTSASFLEAMSCGLYPIVTDIPGFREWIISEQNGILVPPNNVSALVEALKKIINGEVDLEAARIANRQSIVEFADLNKCMTDAAELYEEVLLRQ